MSFRTKGILSVLITGSLSMYIGWLCHAHAAGSVTLAVMGVLVGFGLLGVGSWIAVAASKSGYSDRMRLLVEHLQIVRDRGDYSIRQGLEGDDEVAKAAAHVDAILGVVVHRLDELRVKAGQDQKAKEEVHLELSDSRARLADEILHRQRSEDGLRKALADFEQRVRERTEELSASNDALVEEVSQRTHAESALRELHLELEQRVEERTFELALANEMLVKEIQDRRLAEGEREKLVSLVENAHDFIGLASLDGQITFLNAAAMRLLGLDPTHPELNLRIEDIEGDSSRGAFRDLVLRQVVSAGSWDGELELRNLTQPGRKTDAEVSAFLVCDPETSKPLCVAFVLRDITARRQAERALKELEERFSKAFHASPSGVAILARAGGRFVDVNRSFLRSLGYEQPEVVGKTVAELDLWASPDQEVRLNAELDRKQSVSNFQCRWRARNGDLRELRIAVETMDLGRESCLLVVTEDITDRLKLEDQLRQSQKMEAVGQLAAGIAHDFNNILTVVQGHAELMLGQNAPPAASIESMRCVSSAADKAAKLTRQLLTFSRKQVVQWSELDLNKVIRDVSGMLRSLISENIRLSFHYHEAPPLIRGDVNMLEQVLLNLVVNARDAMPKGGNLVVDTSVCEFDDDVPRRNPKARAGRFVCLTVMDGGCGMDPATLERIFEPFFTTKEFGRGTGLGLATVYGVVTQHNGWVEVTSQPGNGTLFRIFLPALTTQPPRKVEPPEAKPGEPRGGRETVLVVEDEMGLRMLVEAVLQKYGYKVILAEHGLEAIKLWGQQPGRVDLLLTDMVMPEGITGLELSEKLRADDHELRVIYMSGYSVDFGENGVSGVQEGVNFLQKPYKPDQLVRAVRQVLDLPPQPLPQRDAAASSSPVGPPGSAARAA